MDRPDNKNFTTAYFLESDRPYANLYAHRDNPFEQTRKKTLLKAEAKKVGVGARDFEKLYRTYVESIQAANAKPVCQLIVIPGQDLQLTSDDWQASVEEGIFRYTVKGKDIACPHFIMPSKRLINIDTGTEKMEISYKVGGRWRHIITAKSNLASPQKIVELADRGISVATENAKSLIKYLQDIEMLNYDRISEAKSITRLGWIDNYGFSPYVPDLVFDGDEHFRSAYGAVRAEGSYDEWLKIAAGVRSESLTVRILLTASFASILVKVCGCLPFFVHLWGTESGTGKTVGLMLSASVWADPEIGRFVQTFNSTDVGQERMISFVNSLPLIT